MTAQAIEVTSDLTCGGCGKTTDQCLTLREDCCSGCTHYPEPIDDDVDEVAVARAVAGDTSVPLNRAEYAAAHRQLQSEGKSANQIASLLGTSQRQIERWNGGYTHPISRRPGGRAMTTTEELLTKAARHPAKRVQAAAHRAQDAIQRVSDLLAEDAGKAQARARVERLERELREAKAALRGGSVPTTQTTGGPPRTFGDGDHKCRKGCGKSSPNPQGRAAHERFCAHEAGAVA